MAILMPILRLLAAVNTVVLRIGRTFAWIAIGLMVVIILIQVVFRYVFAAALPWPDEAARFLMLWMTGLIAPSAYRWGGFVSIDLIKDTLPRVVGALLGLALLALSLAVLLVGLQFGIKHVNSGWLFASSSLKLPLAMFGLGTVPVKLAWMYMSLPIGLVLLISVNVELIVRLIVDLIDPHADVPKMHDQLVISAE